VVVVYVEDGYGGYEFENRAAEDLDIQRLLPRGFWKTSSGGWSKVCLYLSVGRRLRMAPQSRLIDIAKIEALYNFRVVPHRADEVGWHPFSRGWPSLRDTAPMTGS